MPDVILPSFDRVTVSIASLMKLFIVISCIFISFFFINPFGPFPLYIPPPASLWGVKEAQVKIAVCTFSGGDTFSLGMNE